MNYDNKEAPDLQAAIAAHRSESAAEKLSTIEEGEDIPWNSWKVTGHRAYKEDFESLLAFFVNLPGLDERKTWLWSKLSEQVAIPQAFNAEEPPGVLFESSPSLGTQLIGGWVLSREYGRVDEDTTDSTTTYLLETERSYMYLRCYKMTLH